MKFTPEDVKVLAQFRAYMIDHAIRNGFISAKSVWENEPLDGLAKSYMESPFVGQDLSIEGAPMRPPTIRAKEVANDADPLRGTYHFTFGTGHIQDGYVLPIVALSPEVAREKMIDLYDNQWAFQYTEKEWQQSLAEGFFKKMKMLPKIYCI